MAETAADMAARRFGAAARNLERILAWRPGSDEAAYVLGICEQTRGRNQAADQAWARVTPGSSFLQRAVLAQLRLFHDTGRLASAEQLVLDAAKDPRNDPTELLVLLVPIYSQIGRSDDAARLIEDRWTALKGRGEATPDESIKLVRLHIELTSKTPPVENIRAYLDQVGRLAPEDDRVWLGRAHLAIQTEAHDEARRWLDACTRRRPDDIPVWRAWLRYGIASHRADVVQNAMSHLPARDAAAADRHRAAAWLAAMKGDRERERRELEQFVELDPADLSARQRLTQLTANTSSLVGGAVPGHAQIERDRLRERYLVLVDRVQHVRNAAEMAQLAEQLGQPFEARVFASLVAPLSR